MRTKIALCSILAALTLARAETSSPTMKALVIHSFGGPEVLKFEEIPRPEPRADQVLVRVVAAAVNPVDTAVRQGYLRQRTGEKFPMIIGYDIAGVVEKAGAKVTKLKPGDAVYAYLTLSGGGYAEYAVASEKEAVRKPNSLTFEEAAAVPLAGETAWQALIDTGKLESGQTVLIHGGSGGVGSLAVQIAKARGAKVIATASTANQETLK